jgi:transformation/transcription domain-associated protein
MVFIKKQAMATAAARAQSANQAMAASANRRPDGDQVMQDATAEVQAEIVKKENPPADVIESQQSQSQTQSHIQQASQSNAEMTPAAALNAGAVTLPSTQPAGASDAQPSYVVRQSWEHVDEVVQILKTAFPLLILSMETMVDQILQRFKATPEEEIYRLICMLLLDAVQVSNSCGTPKRCRRPCTTRTT